MGAKKEKLDHSQVIDRPMQEWSRIFRIQSRCYGYKVEYNRNQTSSAGSIVSTQQVR